MKVSENFSYLKHFERFSILNENIYDFSVRKINKNAILYMAVY
jgi:hypothetical protein